MKKLLSILITLICFTTTYFGQSLPKPIGFINDFENIFTDRQEEILDSLVKNFEKETTIQIAIVTLNDSLTNKPEFDNYTLKLAKDWGVGVKGKDNGILIGISSSLRKMRIQNGYGIEKILTDEETKTLIDSLFVPEFKKDDYFKGTKKGLIGLMNQLEQNRNNELDSALFKNWYLKKMTIDGDFNVNVNDVECRDLIIYENGNFERYCDFNSEEVKDHIIEQAKWIMLSTKQIKVIEHDGKSALLNIDSLTTTILVLVTQTEVGEVRSLYSSEKSK